VCACFFGDGAANQGTFHESINLAAVQRLPVVFVCENNLYATETAVRLATLTEDFAVRAKAYSIPGVIVDGNDVLEVYEKTSMAVEQARAGKGPTLLECKTYRTCGHYVGHGETGYRPKEELEAWRQKDPVKFYCNHVVEHDVLTVQSIARIEEEVEREVKEAVRFALESPHPACDEALEHVFG
jgi:TPP-dependent pyruvate/acetoin dehydrogenase alpha subunit